MPVALAGLAWGCRKHWALPMLLAARVYRKLIAAKTLSHIGSAQITLRAHAALTTFKTLKTDRRILAYGVPTQRNFAHCSCRDRPGVVPIGCVFIQSLASRTATQFLRELPEAMRQGASIRDYH